MEATINFDESAVFVKVVELGSFSGAAREMKVPTSTVSRRVQRLEDNLGVRLLHRTTRKLTMTDAGVEFFRRVSPALEAVREATDLVRGFNSEPSGTIRVTAPADSSGFLGGIISRFITAYPQVSVDLTVTNRQVDLIGEGIDLALRGGKLRDSTLIVMKLMAGEMLMVASPGYLKKHGTPKRLEQLEQHECLIFRAMGTRWPLVGPKGEVTVEVHGRLIADDFGFIRKAAIEGAGIAFMPDLPLRQSLERGRLVRVLPKYGSHESQLSVVYPSAQHLSAKVALFRDFVIEEFARITKA